MILSTALAVGSMLLNTHTMNQTVNNSLYYKQERDPVLLKLEEKLEREEKALRVQEEAEREERARLARIQPESIYTIEIKLHSGTIYSIQVTTRSEELALMKARRCTIKTSEGNVIPKEDINIIHVTSSELVKEK